MSLSNGDRGPGEGCSFSRALLSLASPAPAQPPKHWPLRAGEDRAPKSEGLGSVRCCMDDRLAKAVVVGALTAASIGQAVRVPPEPTKADEYSARFEGPADERPLSPSLTTTTTVRTYNVVLAGKRRFSE